MSDPRCPLCLRAGITVSDSPDPNRDAVRLQCPRCGTFAVDRMVPDAIQRPLAGRLHLVAWATRTASDNDAEVFIDSVQTAEALAASAPTWRTADEGVGRLLLMLAKKARAFTEQLNINNETDYPLIPARDGSEYADLWLLSSQMGYTDHQYRRITPAGWRRVEELRTAVALQRQAFVAMWFDPSMDDAYVSGFKPGIEASQHFSAFRIDRKEYNNKVDDEIVAEIRRSGMLVADFTGNRGGVYFEAGLALGLGMPVIWTCQKGHLKDLHFDTRQYNHIEWTTPTDLADKLDKRIRATVLPLVRPRVL